MYDTIHFWLEKHLAGNINIPAIASKLDNYKIIRDKDGSESILGILNNFKVNIYETGISLKGSLAKFHLQDNIHTLTRSGTQAAIENLSDVLNMPVHLAKVTRADLATHLITKYPPANYYSCLGDKKYYKRLQATSDTLYYNTKPKQLLFYDKVLESKTKGIALPAVYQNTNLLRYEMRHTGRLAKQFNMPEFTASTLYNERFYIGIIDIWIKEYMNIQKINRFILNVENMKTPKDGFELIFGMLLHEKGQSEIDCILADFKARKVFNDPKYYSRLKTMIKEAANKPELTEKNELITELDNEVKAIRQHYR